MSGGEGGMFLLQLFNEGKLPNISFNFVLINNLNIMFVMLLCISTPGKLEKYAYPRWESNLRPLEYYKTGRFEYVGVMYSGEYDAIVMLYSECGYPHRASLKNMPVHAYSSLNIFIFGYSYPQYYILSILIVLCSLSLPLFLILTSGVFSK
jgi:sensor histidine kinase YesM